MPKVPFRKFIPFLAGAYLVALVSSLWTYLVVSHGVFPASYLRPLVREIREWAEFDDAAGTNLAGKVVNDLGAGLGRHRLRSSGLLPGTRPVRSPIFKGRRKPRIFVSPRTPRGYYALQGTFRLKESLHGVLLFDERGRLLHHWPLTQELKSGEGRKDYHTYPHGFVLLKDGTLVSAFDNGNMAARYDTCGRRIWVRRGNVNHTMSFSEDNHLWSVLSPGSVLVKLDLETGRIVRRIRAAQIRKANQHIDIFGIYEGISSARVHRARIRGGEYHINDVEPLPSAYSGAFPSFSPGDLLVSFRNPNLIFVFDPESLRVKWWIHGLTRKQHDPDFLPDGRISVFDNNSHRGLSRIVAVRPGDNRREVLYDGRSLRLRTATRGKHQVIPGKGIAMASPNQGVAYVVDSGGNMIFGFDNVDGKHKYAVTEISYLPPGYFNKGMTPKCTW